MTATPKTFTDAEKRELLERLAKRGEILDYFITTFKHRNLEIACILQNGFLDVDYENLTAYFADGEQSQSEINQEEGAWLDRQRS